MSAMTLRSNQIMNSTDTSSSAKVTTTLSEHDEHHVEVDVAGEERIERRGITRFTTRISVTRRGGVDERADGRRPAG